MDLPEIDRNRMLLWIRWDITFDWFGYPPAMKRVHIAMMSHPKPWGAGELADYTSLPQTTVRRQLEAIGQGGQIERSKAGFRLNDLGIAFAVSFHQDLVKFVRGGRHMNRELVDLIRRAPETTHMNFERMENHVWWPIIDGSKIDDA